MSGFIETDCEGGFKVTKAGMAFILFAITAIGSLSSIITYAVTAKADINTNSEDIRTLEHKIDQINKDTMDTKITMARVEQKLVDIDKSLIEIKQDIKQEDGG